MGVKTHRNLYTEELGLGPHLSINGMFENLNPICFSISMSYCVC